jgi:hypothetical protein
VSQTMHPRTSKPNVRFMTSSSLLCTKFPNDLGMCPQMREANALLTEKTRIERDQSHTRLKKVAALENAHNSYVALACCLALCARPAPDRRAGLSRSVLRANRGLHCRASSAVRAWISLSRAAASGQARRPGANRHPESAVVGAGPSPHGPQCSKPVGAAWSSAIARLIRIQTSCPSRSQ